MDNSAVLDWVVSHYKSLSPFFVLIVTVLYKLVRLVFRAGQIVTLVCQRILAGEDTLHKVATNHLPHLQIEMEKSNDLLQQINANIARLADKEDK